MKLLQVVGDILVVELSFFHYREVRDDQHRLCRRAEVRFERVEVRVSVLGFAALRYCRHDS